MKVVNDAIKSGKFPDNLKLADATTVFKKKNPLGKTNYRPVSALPTVSKKFQKRMEKQTKLLYSKPFISIFVWIPEGYSTQQALLALIEIRKKV